MGGVVAQMTIIQVIAAGFAFGIAGNISLWLVQNMNSAILAFVAGVRNRQAAMLELHKFICPDCGNAAEVKACMHCQKLFMPGVRGGAHFHIHPPE